VKMQRIMRNTMQLWGHLQNEFEELQPGTSAAKCRLPPSTTSDNT
jgi:hypothetical protein